MCHKCYAGKSSFVKFKKNKKLIKFRFTVFLFVKKSNASLFLLSPNRVLKFARAKLDKMKSDVDVFEDLPHTGRDSAKLSAELLMVIFVASFFFVFEDERV